MEFGVLSALIKGIRRNSLTFSLVFATVLLGSSAGALLRSGLRSVGLIWPLAWLASMLVIGLLARYEERLPIRKEIKALGRRILIFGSIALAMLLLLYRCEVAKSYGPDPSEPDKRVIGPRGKR